MDTIPGRSAGFRKKQATDTSSRPRGRRAESFNPGWPPRRGLSDQQALQRVTLRYEGSCRPVPAARLAALKAAVPTEAIPSIGRLPRRRSEFDGHSAVDDSGVAVRTLEPRQESRAGGCLAV